MGRAAKLHIPLCTAKASITAPQQTVVISVTTTSIISLLHLNSKHRGVDLKVMKLLLLFVFFPPLRIRTASQF